MKRRMKGRRRQIIMLAAFCLLAGLTITGALVFSWLGHVLESQKAAARFQGEGEERFAQVSVFFPEGKGQSEEGLYYFHQTLDTKLVEASLEAPPDGKLYRYAYAAEGELTATGPRGNSTAAALGVGGDFFLFHPLELLSGAYIGGDDFMHDRVVLDEELAWRLFGGTDVAGLEILIGGEPYPVAGVVRREDDFATEKAYTGEGGLYMSYETLSALGRVQEIEMYELVCADPISGFVRSIAEEGFSTGVTVQSTGRYGVEREFDILRDFGLRSMNTAGVVYPYWENAARLVEDYAALTLLLTLLCALYPAVLTLIVLILLTRRGWRRLKVEAPLLLDRMQTRRYERRLTKGKHEQEEKDGQA